MPGMMNYVVVLRHPVDWFFEACRFWGQHEAGYVLGDVRDVNDTAAAHNSKRAPFYAFEWTHTRRQQLLGLPVT